jgi:SAM-dependent methyltransferase
MDYKKLLKKLMPESLRLSLRHLLNLFYTLTLTKLTFKLVPKSYHENILQFYSRNAYSGLATLNQHHLIRLIFFNFIDVKIKNNPNYISYFQNLVFKANSAEGWSKSKNKDSSSVYDYYMKDGKNSCLPEIIKYVESLQKVRILDLGCGTGNTIEILSKLIDHKKILKFDGVDFSKNAIDYAINRFSYDKKTYGFFAETIIDFLKAQPHYEEFQYDICYSHLCLQLFSDSQISEIYQYLFTKKICKTIFVSDSLLSIASGDSKYNPGGNAYIRFDHDHVFLGKKAGYLNSKVLADYRDDTLTGFVYWFLS